MWPPPAGPKRFFTLDCNFQSMRSIGLPGPLLSNLLFTGTVPVNKLLLAGTVPVNKFLLAWSPKNLKFQKISPPCQSTFVFFSILRHANTQRRMLSSYLMASQNLWTFYILWSGQICGDHFLFWLSFSDNPGISPLLDFIAWWLE